MLIESFIFCIILFLLLKFKYFMLFDLFFYYLQRNLFKNDIRPILYLILIADQEKIFLN